MTIPAIETYYEGRRFRSRLEARWAVFYTQMGVPWVYEPEGFVLEDGECYLPDFWLPDQGCYVEIKPCHPTQNEEQKCAGLSRVTGRRVFCFFGQPGHHINSGYPVGQVEGDGAHLYRDGEWVDNYYTWCICPWCGNAGIEFEGRGARVCGGAHMQANGDHKAYSFDHRRLIDAYDAANGYRFDRGVTA